MKVKNARALSHALRVVGLYIRMLPGTHVNVNNYSKNSEHGSFCASSCAHGVLYSLGSACCREKVLPA
ncbi:hypothetical protein, partial [Anaplasma phagocytophilum]|uniref:hypothetical protein n=1 Tax=Anaplasma phagocytophilum TaxID=948 RepID=UPI00201AEF1B